MSKLGWGSESPGAGCLVQNGEEQSVRVWWFVKATCRSAAQAELGPRGRNPAGNRRCGSSEEGSNSVSKTGWNPASFVWESTGDRFAVLKLFCHWPFLSLKTCDLFWESCVCVTVQDKVHRNKKRKPSTWIQLSKYLKDSCNIKQMGFFFNSLFWQC